MAPIAGAFGCVTCSVQAAVPRATWHCASRRLCVTLSASPSTVTHAWGKARWRSPARWQGPTLAQWVDGAAWKAAQGDSRFRIAGRGVAWASARALNWITALTDCAALPDPKAAWGACEQAGVRRCPRRQGESVFRASSIERAWAENACTNHPDRPAAACANRFLVQPLRPLQQRHRLGRKSGED